MQMFSFFKILWRASVSKSESDEVGAELSPSDSEDSSATKALRFLREELSEGVFRLEPSFFLVSTSLIVLRTLSAVSNLSEAVRSRRRRTMTEQVLSPPRGNSYHSHHTAQY